LRQLSASSPRPTGVGWVSVPTCACSAMRLV
jgi:hypothetical protein